MPDEQRLAWRFASVARAAATARCGVRLVRMLVSGAPFRAVVKGMYFTPNSAARSISHLRSSPFSGRDWYPLAPGDDDRQHRERQRGDQDGGQRDRVAGAETVQVQGVIDGV